MSLEQFLRVGWVSVSVSVCPSTQGDRAVCSAHAIFPLCHGPQPCPFPSWPIHGCLYLDAVQVRQAEATEGRGCRGPTSSKKRPWTALPSCQPPISQEHCQPWKARVPRVVSSPGLGGMVPRRWSVPSEGQWCSPAIPLVFLKDHLFCSCL